LASWLYVVLWSALTGFVAYGAYRTSRLLETWSPTSNILLGLPDNVLRLALVSLCLALGVWLGPGCASLGWTADQLGRSLAAGCTVGLLLAVSLNATGAAAVRKWGPDVYSDRILRYTLPATRCQWPLVLMSMFISVLLEELLFRSLPLGGMHALIPAEFLMWPLAVCFGLLHSPQGGWGVAGATAAAIVLSLLFLATHSLWATVAAHYVLNIYQIWRAWRLGLRFPA
jgi:membrane protease YdiL (CAAX protease family)